MASPAAGVRAGRSGWITSFHQLWLVHRSVADAVVGARVLVGLERGATLPLLRAGRAGVRVLGLRGARLARVGARGEVVALHAREPAPVRIAQVGDVGVVLLRLLPRGDAPDAVERGRRLAEILALVVERGDEVVGGTDATESELLARGHEALLSSLPALTPPWSQR